uniref:MalT-like TPR region domain-containing protein n=1 Tax=Fagus sylvatica TaxID=28930 RepID=A0A2N9EZV0_FAGSY
MIGVAAKLSRKANSAVRSSRLGPNSNTPYLFCQSPPFRTLHGGINGSDASPVALQMINYALSHARSQKSDESYGQGLLVLEQCLSTQFSEEGQHAENSMGLVLLAMSTLFSERGNFDDAIEKLQRIEDLTHSSLGVRVSAMEALVGLHLELGQDDASSVIADKCLELVEKEEPKTGGGNSVPLSARAKAAKGLVELVCGNLESAETFLQGCGNSEGITGEVHGVNIVEDIIVQCIDVLIYSDLHALAACNMSSEEVLLAATCALGQLEAHMGNYGDAEDLLSRALSNTEDHFGSHHPKVGVVLTCLPLMFRHKAMQEHSSSLLIQEGLYRKAIELLKAPPLETNDAEAKVDRSDIVALARGGYAEALCVQQNRKVQGEKMKSWAEAAWRNRRLSLADVLEISEPSSKVHVIDTRTCRVL